MFLERHELQGASFKLRKKGFIPGESPGAPPEESDDEPRRELRGVVLGVHQQQGLLQLLDVELEQIERLK